jgi:hypothetical protein
VRARPLPSIEELKGYLAEAGAFGVPETGPTEDDLQGLLALALHVADCQKRVSFPGFTWDAPSFLAADDKVTLRFAHAHLDAKDEPGVVAALLENLPRLDRRTLLSLDARASGLREFELEHMLYGQVTLFTFRTRPPEAADHRIDSARERGWIKTLKEHNLLPGRGLVVLDEHQGLLLREPRLQALLGLLVLYPSGAIHLMWNPFAMEGDSELQYWSAWGRGGQASAWKEVFRADERTEE